LTNIYRTSKSINNMSTLEQYQEDISMKFFGRSVSLAKAGNQCVCCGKLAIEFRDEISKREYRISSLCQTCQDEVFAQLPEED
jgi:hypothetical protein